MRENAEPKQRIYRERKTPSGLRRLWQFLLRYTWRVHPGTHLRVLLSPSQAFKVLETAAKPSIDRLQLRNVFAHGRRYMIYPEPDGGFVMTTTNRVFWNRHRRTQPTAVLTGNFGKIDDTHTVVTLHSHTRILPVLRALFMPVFMTSMLVYMPWHPLILVIFIAALFGFSLLAQRFDSQLEAYEMVYFIEKAFEDFTHEPAPQLTSNNADVVINKADETPDFVSAWDKFYEEMRD